MGEIRQKVAVLARHGETEWNKDPSRLRGQIDVPLNDRGREQALEIGGQISKKYKIDHIYASDLSRSVETALEIKRASGARMTPAPWARTWNLGDHQGQLVDDIIPELERLSTKDRDELPPGGGESFNGFLKRFIGNLEIALFHAPDHGRAICVVCHVQNLLVAEAWQKSGCPADPLETKYEYTPESEIPVGDYVELKFDSNGKCSIDRVRPKGA